MSNGRKDLYTGIFFILFAVFLYAQSYAIKMSKADALGPQFFPRLVAVAITILAVVLILKSIAAIKAEKAEAADKPAEASKGIPWNAPLLLTMALLIGYFLLVDKVGFIILTTIYLFCQMFLLLPKGSIKNMKYLIVVAAVSIVIPVGIYMLFYKVFSIFLPAGILG